MYRHNYEKEIIDILVSNGGEIEGFNNLRKLGRGKGFQPNYLRKNLDRMAIERIVIIEKQKNKEKFILVKFDFDKTLKKFTEGPDQIEKRLLKKKMKEKERLLNTREYILEIYPKYNQLLTSWLNAECVEKNKTQVKRIEMAKNHLQRKMKSVLMRLDKHERLNLINSLPYL